MHHSGMGMSLIEDFRCRPHRSIEAEGRYHQSVRKPITRIRHRLQSTRVRLREDCGFDRPAYTLASSTTPAVIAMPQAHQILSRHSSAPD